MTHNNLQGILLTTIFILWISPSLFSQPDVATNPAYGADSKARIECATELSNLAEFMKINHIEYAILSWRKVYKDCPASSKNIYILGARIFTQKLKINTDPVLKEAYFDTLMMIYKDRIKHFGEEGYVLGREGLDILRYHGNEYDKAYRSFKKSVELVKGESDVNVMVALMETAFAMYKDDSISAEELLTNYLLVTESLNAKPSVGSRKTIVDGCIAKINSIIKMANINDCVVIEKTFINKINNEPQNLSLLNLVISLMENSGCDNSEFYGHLFEKAVQNDNSADISFKLAKYYIKKEKFKDAMIQLENAAGMDTVPANKAQYYYQMSVISNVRLNNPQASVNYAEKALEIKSDWGDPYLQIASAYIEGMKNCSDDPFVRSTVFWVASDLCVKARTADPSVRNKANDLIAEYSRFFPSKEDLFFRSLTDGSEYSIGCWINQKTTVRARN